MNFLDNITGSFSNPAAENPTVAMVEAAYQHHGLNYRYLNCQVSSQQLANAVLGARAMDWAGFNCSLPHKVDVIQHLDGLGESARIIGAVNCVVRRDGKYIGENTDGKGFVQSLEGVIDPAGKSMVIFGAGGASRAICVEMALAGVSHIIVVNRSQLRGEELVALLNEETAAQATLVEWSENYFIPAETDIVVNATSVGLFPNVDDHLDIDYESLRSGMLVADVIPNPPNTHLLQAAAARHARTIDGLGMLVNQGVTGIKYWTGIDVDPTLMRAKLDEIFGA